MSKLFKHIVIKLILMGVLIVISCATFAFYLSLKKETEIFYSQKPFTYETADPIEIIKTYEVKNNKVYYKDSKISADPKTFVILKGNLSYQLGNYVEYRYARDDKNVFYAGQLLLRADPATFKPIENGLGFHNYGLDKNTVYFEGKPLANADPETFKILWRNQYEGCGMGEYGRDAKHVYHREDVLAWWVNPDTFQPLISYYGKDLWGYYYKTKYIGPFIDREKISCPMG